MQYANILSTVLLKKVVTMLWGSVCLLQFPMKVVLELMSPSEICTQRTLLLSTFSTVEPLMLMGVPKLFPFEISHHVLSFVKVTYQIIIHKSAN